MKPITHPLAIAALTASAAWNRTKTRETTDSADVAAKAWIAAGCPLYVDAESPTDPTPLPAPAPGMRAWYSYDGAGYDGKPLRCSGSADISEIGEGDAWDDWVVPDRIDLITDYRTGEVLWRRA